MSLVEQRKRQEECLFDMLILYPKPDTPAMCPDGGLFSYADHNQAAFESLLSTFRAQIVALHIAPAFSAMRLQNQTCA